MSKTNIGYDTGMITRTARDAALITRTIHRIEDREMAADGPMTPVLRAASNEELRRIYLACRRIEKRWSKP